MCPSPTDIDRKKNNHSNNSVNITPGNCTRSTSLTDNQTFSQSVEKGGSRVTYDKALPLSLFSLSSSGKKRLITGFKIDFERRFELSLFDEFVGGPAVQPAQTSGFCDFCYRKSCLIQQMLTFRYASLCLALETALFFNY